MTFQNGQKIETPGMKKEQIIYRVSQFFDQFKTAVIVFFLLPCNAGAEKKLDHHLSHREFFNAAPFQPNKQSQ